MMLRFSFLPLLFFIFILSSCSDSFDKSEVGSTIDTSTFAKIALTETEKSWLAEKNVVRVRVGDNPPLHFFDGEYKGISVDYFNLIAELLGLEIEYINNISWPDALDNIKKQEVIDLLLTGKNTKERQPYMRFSDDYLLMPWVIFSRTDSDFISSVNDLIGKTVAVEKNFAMQKKLMTVSPPIKLLLKNNPTETLQAVASGEADAYIGNLATSSYIIDKENLANLKVASPTHFGNHNQAFVVRNDWPELVSLLNKALTAIPRSELSKLRNKWFNVDIDYGISKADVFKWLAAIVGGSVIFVLFLSYRNRILSAEIAKRKIIEKELNEISLQQAALIKAANEYQKQLEHIAHYDILTNLPNRSLLADRLSQSMLHCRRQAQSLAVVFLDLDGFKQVNDTHGHNVGDDLLIALSERLKTALREGDSLARIGGDEFVAVLTGLDRVGDCEPVLERLLQAASEPVIIDDVVLAISASIGFTLYPQDKVDADLLMRHADQAMYVSKASGKNCYHLFDTAQDDAVKVQRESIEAIRVALDNHQFVLFYQPKVNMRTGLVTGTEALIRWQHPQRGLLNPIDFLPLIESHSMMIEVGEWVIDSALTQISQWQAMGGNLPLNISVNIAAVQLQQPNFTQRLSVLLANHADVKAHFLELEVLETSALDDVYHVSKVMGGCMALGVKFALDDFGTGYSSLTHLRRLPANLVKIDQSFIRDMMVDADDLAIVEGVIALAKSFKREVIAEGVETIEHGTALLQLGCDLAQGYGIARPMPASEIPSWISNWKPDASWEI